MTGTNQIYKKYLQKKLSSASARKYKLIPSVDVGIPIIISDADYKHTGSCNPST